MLGRGRRTDRAGELARITAGAARRDELARRFEEERNRWKDREHPLSPEEKVAYLQHLRRPRAGFEQARVALLRAIFRLEAHYTVRNAPKTP